MRTRLEAGEIADRCTSVPEWTVDGNAIVRTYECPSFADAIAFVVRIGFFAEAKDHHPDLDIRWRKVRVLFTTHDVGGLTDWDFELAAAIDGVAP